MRQYFRKSQCKLSKNFKIGPVFSYLCLPPHFRSQCSNTKHPFSEELTTRTWRASFRWCLLGMYCARQYCFSNWFTRQMISSTIFECVSFYVTFSCVHIAFKVFSISRALLALQYLLDTFSVHVYTLLTDHQVLGNQYLKRSAMCLQEGPFLCYFVAHYTCFFPWNVNNVDHPVTLATTELKVTVQVFPCNVSYNFFLHFVSSLKLFFS